MMKALWRPRGIKLRRILGRPEFHICGRAYHSWLSQFPTIYKSFRKIYVSTSQKFGNIFSQEIVRARAAHASVKMIMKNEMNGPYIREFEAIL
jgi:hypothetical protein